MHYGVELFCICGGTKNSRGTAENIALLCPYCRSKTFDVATLEDNNQNPVEDCWKERVVGAFACSNCDFTWNATKGCPRDAMCERKHSCSPRSNLVSYIPRNSTEYAVIIEKNSFMKAFIPDGVYQATNGAIYWIVENSKGIISSVISSEVMGRISAVYRYLIDKDVIKIYSIRNGASFYDNITITSNPISFHLEADNVTFTYVLPLTDELLSKLGIR